MNDSIKTIQGNCKHLYQTHQSRGVSGQIAPPSLNQSKSRFYSVASQMKLLVDTPEKVWNALEHHEYLKAAQLYLLAQNIVSSLHIDTGTSAPSKLLASFPILPRQWSSISHFKDSILQGSRKLLRDHTQSEQTVAECLCAIMFLEDSSPRQVFNEFLVARQASLQELFHPSQQATGIKTQLCEVVRLVMSSLYQVFVLFNGDDVKETETGNASLLFEMISKMTSRSDSSTSEGELLKQLFGQDFDLALLRHLPASVAGFRPRLRSISSYITREYIQNNCKTWFQKCAEDVKKGMDSFLQYVGTLKGLASIRDAVWDLVNPSVDNGTSTYHNAVLRKWEAVTSSCLGNKLSLWHELFRDEFVARSKTILHGQLEALTSSCKSSTVKALEELCLKASKPDRSVLWERDLSSYVWYESSTDLPSKAGWTGKQRDSDVMCGEGGLSLKTKACTPVIQGLCNAFNDRLALILDDAAYFIKYSRTNDFAPNKSGFQSNVTTQSRDSTSSEDHEGPFDRYGESEELEEFLQTTCSDVIRSLLTHFDALLSSHKNELATYSWDQPLFRKDTPGLILAVDRALLLARLCRGLSDYCANLGELMGEKKEEKTRKPRFPKTPTRKKASGKTSSKMQEIKERLRATYLSAFSIWSQWVSAMFRTSFQTYLLNGQGPNALLSATNCDEIVIDEETEAGQKVHSSIHVPSQVSSYVTSLLFSLCEELNRVGGHALDRSILRELVRGLGDDVLACYEKLLERHYKDKQNAGIDQNRALQAVFDFKFLSTVFGERSKVEESSNYKPRFEKVVEQLEDIVDPFDLNVFSPYLSSNLNKHLQRCGVLFGVLLSIDKHSQFYGMPQRPSRGPQDQHNVMPIAVNPVRFTLLPLSSHHVEKHDAHNTKNHEESPDTEKIPCDLPFYKHQQFVMSELLIDTRIRDC